MDATKVLIVAASQRSGSQTSRVAKLMGSKIRARGGTAELLDLASEPLPLWDVTSETTQEAIELRERWSQFSALVLVTPEWNGLPTPAALNFVTWVGNAMADRPTLLVSVSTGLGGAYALSTLRVSSQKNSFLCVLPDQLLFRHVDKALTGSGPALSLVDDRLDARVEHVIGMLLAYARALHDAGVRGERDVAAFPHGT